MRVITIFLFTVPIASLAFHVADIMPAFFITIIFAFGVTELVNLVYEIRQNNEKKERGK